MDWLDKLAMSGYAGYVWSSYGISVGLLVLLYIVSKVRLKKAQQARQQLQQMVSSDEGQ